MIFHCSVCWDIISLSNKGDHRCSPRKEKAYNDMMDYLIKENNDEVKELMDHDFESREEMIKNMEDDYDRLPEGLRIGGRIHGRNKSD